MIVKHGIHQIAINSYRLRIDPCMHVIKEMTAVFLRVNNYIWCILIYIYFKLSSCGSETCRVGVITIEKLFYGLKCMHVDFKETADKLKKNIYI